MISETRGWKRDEYGYYTKLINDIEYCLWKTSGFIEAWVVRAGGEIVHHPRSKKGDYITRLDDAKRAAHALARETK